ncbi:TatD family hydrolase [Cohnella abietis]|uniref:DNase TatD n=1 Tax=Cohnella abietis TaxID=2507935 RepID=A0A3T1DBY8_9BACL|nr:TatD family hydrolase [Cohnella abietis]BBI35455.1 DNase TatD [Cohnella abietis]
MNQIIDIGVNLLHRSFQQDREDVLLRAEAEGVFPLILTGTSVRSSKEAADYAAKYPGKLYSTAGVHPHDARNCDASTIKKLRELAAFPHVVAIGECGLDYNRDFSPREIQKKWFQEQVELACEMKLPLFLHEREAFYDFTRLLRSYQGRLPRTIVHCFTGTAQELQVYLEMGFYIGITGWICDERRGKHLRELVKRIPLNRLMVETDAPFLTPRDLSVKPADGRNEPMYLPHILRSVAKCLDRDSEEIAAATTSNAKAFFGIE